MGPKQQHESICSTPRSLIAKDRNAEIQGVQPVYTTGISVANRDRPGSQGVLRIAGNPPPFAVDAQ